MSHVYFETHPWLVIIDWPKLEPFPDRQHRATFPYIMSHATKIQEWLNDEIGNHWLSGGTNGLVDPDSESFRVKVADEMTAAMVLLRWA